MDTKEKKLNFLNSLEDDAVSSAEIVRFLLPYILSGTDPYTLLTRVNINRGLHQICESDVENFYKTLYDTWFSSLSRLNKDNTEPAVLEIIEIFKSQELTPENTTPKQAKEFFENSTNRYLMQAIFPIYISHSRKILDGDKTNHLFVYVKPSALHRKFTKCECRLYLNLKPKNAITMGAILGELCEEKNIPLCYKFWTADNERNDSFLVYTNYDHVAEIVDEIKKIEKTNPELFAGSTQANPFLARVDNFIYFGEEPKKYPVSFTRARANAISDFVKTVGKDNLLDLMQKEELDTAITNADLERYFKKYGISVYNPYLNLETQKELDEAQNNDL